VLRIKGECPNEKTTKGSKETMKKQKKNEKNIMDTKPEQNQKLKQNFQGIGYQNELQN
jgi:hypothetical protein